MKEDDQVPWHCIPCLIFANAEIFPEFYDLLDIDLQSQIDIETTSKLTNLPNLKSCDLH